MRSLLECVPCFFHQALRAAQEAGLDEALTRQLLNEIGRRLEHIDQALPPPVNGAFLYRRVAELSGNPDPFATVKRQHNELALSLVPGMRDWIDRADDRVDAAARIAAAGNLIDLGAQSRIGDLDAALKQALERDHQLWEIDSLSHALDVANAILVVGDNAGETVFDRLLLEELARRRPEATIAYAVRGGPIINDATADDARAAGIDRVAEILSTGSDIPGILLEAVDDDFLQWFATADLVISKGQGNFETLADQGDQCNREVFFILTVKCGAVSQHLGVPQGASVLTRG
jgi:uncharacterized protein with ATP-grasp and redox domains